MQKICQINYRPPFCILRGHVTLQTGFDLLHVKMTNSVTVNQTSLSGVYVNS